MQPHPHMPVASRRALLVLLAGTAVAAVPAAVAAGGTYITRSLTQTASTGLVVTGTLSDLVATSNARVLIPTSWRTHTAPAGQLRLANTQNQSCHFDITYKVTSVLAPDGPASDYVTPKLPAATSKHLLDSGQRGNRAFRVVRQPGIGGVVRVDALWAGVLTKRADITSGGNVAWTEIRVSARSRKGDECHSGTWREGLGPALGDSLAVARTKLRFTRKR